MGSFSGGHLCLLCGPRLPSLPPPDPKQPGPISGGQADTAPSGSAFSSAENDCAWGLAFGSCGTTRRAPDVRLQHARALTTGAQPQRPKDLRFPQSHFSSWLSKHLNKNLLVTCCVSKQPSSNQTRLQTETGACISQCNTAQRPQQRRPVQRRAPAPSASQAHRGGEEQGRRRGGPQQAPPTVHPTSPAGVPRQPERDLRLREGGGLVQMSSGCGRAGHDAGVTPASSRQNEPIGHFFKNSIIRMTLSFKYPFPSRLVTGHGTRFPVLYGAALLSIQPGCNSSPLPTPNSQSVPPRPPSAPSPCPWVCPYFTAAMFQSPRISGSTHGICPPDFLHLA